MGRIVCFDYGRARIGVSASDPRKIIASPVGVFKRHKNIKETFKEIGLKVASLAPVDLLLVGLPLLLSGKEGDMALEAKAFAEGLSLSLNIPYVCWDERLSSSQADRMMKEDSLSRKKRAGLVDTLASTVILQSYLERIGRSC